MNQEKIVLVGIAHRNTLSGDHGEPRLFVRIFEQREWIKDKLYTWSNWTPCDHTCQQKRTRICEDEFHCRNDIVSEYRGCSNDSQRIIYEDVSLDNSKEKVI